MTVSYAALFVGNTTWQSANRIDSRIQNVTTGYMRFPDMATAGLTEGDVDSAQLRTRVTAKSFDTQTHVLRSAQPSDSDDWGTTLDSTAADYASTGVNAHDSKSISATGYLYWDLDKTLIDWTAENHFRIRSITQPAVSRTAVTFASQSHATVAYRPQIIVQLAGGVAPNTLPLLGSTAGGGGGGGEQIIYGNTADGSIRQTFTGDTEVDPEVMPES